MANLAQLFQATKSESTLLVLYIPSGDRDVKPIEQEHWVDKALETLGTPLWRRYGVPTGQGRVA
jgi:hypothetical protein